MAKINWKQKLSSRKFWAAVAAWLSANLGAFGLAQNTVAQVVLLVGGIAHCACICSPRRKRTAQIRRKTKNLIFASPLRLAGVEGIFCFWVLTNPNYNVITVAQQLNEMKGGNAMSKMGRPKKSREGRKPCTFYFEPHVRMAIEKYVFNAKQSNLDYSRSDFINQAIDFYIAAMEKQTLNRSCAQTE